MIEFLLLFSRIFFRMPNLDIIYNVIKAVTWDEINTNKCDPPWENREKGERTGTRAMTRHANRVTCFSDMHICNKQNNEYGYLNAKTMNVFTKEKKPNCIKSKL